MKALGKLLGVFLLLAILLGALLVAALYGSRASTSGTLEVTGLEAPVKIQFDEWQRPFVKASSLGDAFFAEGFLHASHRLWQMETLRRAGSGRLAEMLGEDALSTDMELWRFGAPQLAQQLQANASDELAGHVKSYVAGVNAGLQGYRVMPPEFLLLRHTPAPWTAADVYAVGAMTAYQSANNVENELLRLALLEQLGGEQFALFLDDNSERADYPFIIGRGETNGQPLTAIPEAPSADPGTVMALLDRIGARKSAHNPHLPRLGFGSNGWAVAADRSATGRALFAFDSHDELGLPNLFYEVHLFFGDGQEIRGWSVAGLPGVINGFNEHIAWGFTNIGDTQDLFLERACKEVENGFHNGEQCEAARVEHIEIPVRDREPEALRLLHTHNGPLLSEQPALSIRWSAHYVEDHSLDAILQLNLASNPEEIRAALDQWAAPSLNATWADVNGNIGFRTAGLLPRRGAGQGLFPLRGDKPDYAWQGFVDPGEQPRQLNPRQGFVAAANARVNPPGEGPLVSADNASAYRIAHLQDRLSRGQSFTVQDMQDLQMDWTDGQASHLLPVMLADIEDQALSPAAAQARELLHAWREDPVSSPESAAALLFQAWYMEIGRVVFEPSLGPGLMRQLLKQSYLFNHALDNLLLSDRHAAAWPEMAPGFRALVLAGALEDTVSTLQGILGDDLGLWRLDQLQAVHLEHELARAAPELAALFSEEPQPWGGSTATLGRAGYSYLDPFKVRMAATVRTVGEMQARPKMSAVIPGGQSGHPLSPHYSDQFPAWLQGQLLPIASELAELPEAALELVPEEQ